jgi:hypothetical protein
MNELLTIICIHSRDIITTKKLLCVCKDGFGDENIWTYKFCYEFPDKGHECDQSNQWSCYDIYAINKINNFSISLIKNVSYYHTTYDVDHYLWEYSPIYQLFFDSLDNTHRCDLGSYDPPSIIRFNILRPFILIDCHHAKVLDQFLERDRAEDAQNTKRSLCPYGEYMIVHLTDLTPMYLK